MLSLGFSRFRSDRASEAAPSEQSQPSHIVGGGSQRSSHGPVTAGHSSWFDSSVNLGASSSRATPSAVEDFPRVTFSWCSSGR